MTRLQLEGQTISRAAISHWETGRYNPPLDSSDFRLALAKALKMDVSELLRSAGYEISRSNYSDAAKRAAAIIEHLPPKGQEMALDYLQMLEKRFASD